MTWLYALLVAGNLGAWVWAFWAFHGDPVLLGTGLLAYGFGLRHAVDADHIAAIDNVTRKMLQDGRRPLGVGFFFSLGHATVVIAATVLVVVAAGFAQRHLGAAHRLGSVVGTLVSAGFLMLIAAMNLRVLRDVYRDFRSLRGGAAPQGEGGTIFAAGLLGRLFRPLFVLVTRSWHMYPLGLLFGLGFDTATEIGLLGLSAAESAKGLGAAALLAFPALFTAGMMLVDTTDSILMLGAYGWAMTKPLRKLYYNLTVTLASVLVALMVGGIEALGLIGDAWQFDGAAWRLVRAAGDHLSAGGYLVVALFALCWGVSLLVYRMRGYDKLELAETAT